MRAIFIAFEPLQIVALVVVLGRHPVVGRCPQHLVRRQQWRLTRPHVRKDDPSCLPARVGWMPYGEHEIAPLWFARGLETPPMHIVEPAVVNASEASVLQAAIAQVCGPMGAVPAQ